MKITITINTDNAAFSNGRDEEVSRILKELGTKIQHVGVENVTTVRDFNGNKVGEVIIIDDDVNVDPHVFHSGDGTSWEFNPTNGQLTQFDNEENAIKEIYRTDREYGELREEYFSECVATNDPIVVSEPLAKLMLAAIEDNVQTLGGFQNWFSTPEGCNAGKLNWKLLSRSKQTTQDTRVNAIMSKGMTITEFASFVLGVKNEVETLLLTRTIDTPLNDETFALDV